MANDNRPCFPYRYGTIRVHFHRDRLVRACGTLVRPPATHVPHNPSCNRTNDVGENLASFCDVTTVTIVVVPLVGKMPSIHRRGRTLRRTDGKAHDGPATGLSLSLVIGCTRGSTRNSTLVDSAGSGFTCAGARSPSVELSTEMASNSEVIE